MRLTEVLVFLAHMLVVIPTARYEMRAIRFVALPRLEGQQWIGLNEIVDFDLTADLVSIDGRPEKDKTVVDGIIQLKERT